jgi:hypothetical protein
MQKDSNINGLARPIAGALCDFLKMSTFFLTVTGSVTHG